jgi:hypothetical protein
MCVPLCDLCEVSPIIFGKTRCIKHLLCTGCNVNDPNPLSYFCNLCLSNLPCRLCKINKRVLFDKCADCIHFRR